MKLQLNILFWGLIVNGIYQTLQKKINFPNFPP